MLLIQALINSPDLLILDEPFDGLDINARKQLTAILSELKRQGITLILVLNRLDEIPEYADKLGWVLNREFKQFQNRETFLQDSLTQQLMHIENESEVMLPSSLGTSTEQTEYDPLIEMNQSYNFV